MTSITWQRTTTRLSQFMALTKPRVVSLIVFCAIIGMFLAVPPEAIDAHFAWRVIAATVGIALVAAIVGANPQAQVTYANAAVAGNDIVVTGSWVTIMNLQLRDTKEAAIWVKPGANHIVINDTEVINTGIGFKVRSQSRAG